MKKQRSNTGNKRKFYNLRKYSRDVHEALVTSEDLLREIFFRVPAKSLIRFKCVSKQWLSLISDPMFFSDYTRMNITSSVHGVFFKYSDDPDMKYVSLSKDDTSHPWLPFKFESGCGYTLKHVSHGLALYSNVLEINAPLVVCNITTRQRKVLPKRRYSSKDDLEMSCFVFLDPTKSFHYRVVVVIDRPCHEIDVYSLETDSWKYLNFSVPRGDPLTRKVLCNGAIHWMTCENIHVRFEIEAEKLIVNHMPPEPIDEPISEPEITDKRYLRYFGECGGNLLVIKYACKWGGDNAMKIIEMDRDYCGWTVKSPRVDLKHVTYSSNRGQIKVGGIYLQQYSVLCFVKRGNDLQLLLALPRKIFSYSLALNKFEVLQRFPKQNKSEYAHAYPFHSTLMSPL